MVAGWRNARLPGPVDGSDAILHTPIGDLDGKSITTSKAFRARWRTRSCGLGEEQVSNAAIASRPIMTAVGFLTANPKPTDADIDEDTGMAHNVCRCATYHRIRAAIHDAAKTLEG